MTKPEEKFVFKNEAQMIDESLSVAFPKAMKKVRELRPGGHRQISVDARGRSNLRKAILMSEVLGPPRAFDV